MTIKEFISEFKSKKISNTKISPTAVQDALREMLEVKSYLPFKAKYEIAQAIVNNNITVENGYKKVNSATQFLGFIMAMLVSHTNLEIEDAYEDYDMLCESDLLQSIIETFQKDYSECETMVRMVQNDALQDNNIQASIIQFLDGISENLGGFGEVLKEKLSSIDWSNILDVANLSDENKAAITQILNK